MAGQPQQDILWQNSRGRTDITGQLGQYSPDRIAQSGQHAGRTKWKSPGTKVKTGFPTNPVDPESQYQTSIAKRSK
jgi:hypothetical protein